MNTMFASVIAGAVSAAAVAAGGVMLDAAVAESARRALSRAASFFAQVATVTSTKSATVRDLGMALPPPERGDWKNRRQTLTFCKRRSNRPRTARSLHRAVPVLIGLPVHEAPHVEPTRRIRLRGVLRVLERA